MGTRYQGTTEENRVLDSYVKIVRASNSLVARLGEEFHHYGLTESQFGVLEALYHMGPLCLSDLSRKILKSEANMTLIVDNLERDGLVVRKRSNKDRRYIVIHLTKAGREKIKLHFQGHVQVLVTLFQVLEPAEQEELARLCKKLGLSVGGDRYKSASGCRSAEDLSDPEDAVCEE
jgi:MarR family transcriptional regulator, 2-MHQ and catechol-resistance regulon repressor